MMKQALESALSAAGFSLTPEQVEKMAAFAQALVEKNQVMNLTAITQPQAVAQLHFVDSLTVLQTADCENRSIIDIGCGAGFPGVPLAIAQPAARVTLLDSLGKRMKWLEEVLPQLGIDAQVVCARAEEYAASCRETYDLAVSRAVARLPILSELCLPYVRVGGSFLALKGAMTGQEVQEARRAIDLLGGQVREVRSFPVAGENHQIVVVDKVRPTPAAYPRPYAKIKQRPL